MTLENLEKHRKISAKQRVGIFIGMLDRKKKAPLLGEEQVLNQNFQANQNQDDTADQLCLGLIAGTEYGADFDSDHRDHKGGAADKSDRWKNVYIQKGEGYADSQCIDTGCNGEDQHGFDIHRGIAGLCFLVQ